MTMKKKPGSTDHKEGQIRPRQPLQGMLYFETTGLGDLSEALTVKGTGTQRGA